MPRCSLFRLSGLLLGAIIASGCASQGSGGPLPKEQYGRHLESGTLGRVNVSITPRDSSVSYFFYPAYIQAVYARPAPLDSVTAANPMVPVELLIEGAFADDCSELDAAAQTRMGHILHVTLTMRRPRGAVCTRLERPYRFYLTLDGRYEPGSYLVKVNEAPFTFVIRPPEPEPRRP